MRSKTPLNIRIILVGLIGFAWLILVNGLFFWQRLRDSDLIQRILERLGGG